MPDEEILTPEQELEPPTGGEETPSQTVETDAQGLPTGPLEDEETDLEALQAKVDGAETDEERESAVKARNAASYRLRQKAKEARTETQQVKQDAAYWKGRAEALQERPETPVATKPAQEVGPQLPPRPDASQWTDEDGFEDPDKKTEIIADWRADCKLIQRDFESNRTRQQNQQSEWESQGEEKFQGFKDRVMPLKRVLSSVSEDKAMSFSVAVSESSKSHELAIYLAENPREAQRLLSLSTPSTLREIGKLEDRLEKPKSKKTSDAPAPITSVKTGDATIASLDDIQDDDDWLKAYQAKKFKEKGRAY